MFKEFRYPEKCPVLFTVSSTDSEMVDGRFVMKNSNVKQQNGISKLQNYTGFLPSTRIYKQCLVSLLRLGISYSKAIRISGHI